MLRFMSLRAFGLELLGFFDAHTRQYQARSVDDWGVLGLISGFGLLCLLPAKARKMQPCNITVTACKSYRGSRTAGVGSRIYGAKGWTRIT